MFDVSFNLKKRLIQEIETRLIMFALQPRGKRKKPPSQFRTSLNFFGKLGIYYGIIRSAYLYFAGKEISSIEN